MQIGDFFFFLSSWLTVTVMHWHPFLLSPMKVNLSELVPLPTIRHDYGLLHLSWTAVHMVLPKEQNSSQMFGFDVGMFGLSGSPPPPCSRKNAQLGLSSYQLAPQLPLQSYLALYAVVSYLFFSQFAGFNLYNGQ